MNKRQVAVLGSVTASIAGVAWACSVGSPMVYGSAPTNWTNSLQTLFGSLLGGGGIISTIVLVLKKFGVNVPDESSSIVEKLIDDYRKGKMIDVAEDMTLTSALMFRVRAKDAAGIQLATQLIQHVMVNGGKVVTETVK